MNPLKPLLTLITLLSLPSIASAAGKYDNPDTIVVARDGTGEFRTGPGSVSVWVREKAFEDIIINE